MREKPSSLEFRGQGEQSGLNLASLDQAFSDISKLRWLISFSFYESLFIAVSYLLLYLQLDLERVVVMTRMLKPGSCSKLSNEDCLFGVIT